MQAGATEIAAATSDLRATCFGFGAPLLFVLLLLQATPAPSPHPYDPTLFGSDKPLVDLLRERGVDLVDGEWLPKAAIIVLKSERRLLLHADGRLLKAYRIQLGSQPAGRKRKVGDGRTPEGEYVICGHNPTSKYYLSLQIDYPNAADVAQGLADGILTPADAAELTASSASGCPPGTDTPLGGNIFIHGQHPKTTEERAKWGLWPSDRHDLQLGDIDPATLETCYDWTLGCIALTNPDIRELYRFVQDGTPIRILP